MNKNYKNLIKISAIGIIAVVGLFGFYRGAASSALLRTAKEAVFSSNSGMMS